ncbi:MAG: hypothetical protein R2722_11685 [Tessaracoccus sp.]
MHDLLLHCLQLIASPWSTMSSEARSLCSSTVEQLPRIPPEEHWARTEPIGTYLRQVLADEPCELTWKATANGCPCFPPRPSIRLPESVRNVSKHCDVAEATISIHSQEATVRVKISDSGPGFETDATTAYRDGWQRSVVERMASVGGSATMRRNSRGGTITVSLILADPASPTAGAAQLSRAAASLRGPYPAGGGQLGEHAGRPTRGWSLPAAITIWTGIVAVLLGAAAVLRRATLTSRAGWLLTILATVMSRANFAWIDPQISAQTSNGWDIWIVSLTGSIMLLVLPSQPFIWRGIAMAALFCGGNLLGGFIFLGREAMATTHYAVLAALSYTTITLILSFGATTVSRYAH